MRRRVMLCLTLTLVSACWGDDATRPKLDPASSPSPLISDGNHNSGNKDFFFLPPLVRDPKTLPGGAPNPLWNAGASNTELLPSVRICELDVVVDSRGVIAPANAVTDGTPCKSARIPGAYDVTTQLTSANVSRGILDDVEIDNAVTRFLSHYSSFVEPYYHLGWRVPAGPIGTSKPPAFYRIVVAAGDNPPLGILDIESVNNFTQLRNVKTNEFVPLTSNLRVPINFRIEQYALCPEPGVGPCATAQVDLENFTKKISVKAALNPAKPTFVSGLDLFPKAQAAPGVASAAAADAEPVISTVTVTSCEDFKVRGQIDLPTFGPCIRVTVEPALTAPLAVAATVFSCEVYGEAIASGVTGRGQSERLTMHQLEEEGEGATLRALPHADPTCDTPTTPLPVESGSSFREMVVALAHGRMKLAAKHAMAMLSPKPLYAARFIDLGGGGASHILDGLDQGGGIGLASARAMTTSDAASATVRDYQLALPAEFDVEATPSGMTAEPGSTLGVTVKVIDLGGQPVRNARVHFWPSGGGTVNTYEVLTALDGSATVQWTLSTTPGVNGLRANGKGIAGADNNGPREGVDPFQPLSTHWGDAADDFESVTVLTGELAIIATGRPPQNIAIYKNYNAWFGANKDETVLQAAPFGFVSGTDYVVRPMSGLASGIPAMTTLIIITSAAEGDLLNQVTEQRAGAANLDAWVRAGGVLVIHAGDNYSPGYDIPGLSGQVDESNGCTGLTLVGTDNAFIRGPDATLGTDDDLTDDNIDNGGRFCADNHGSLAGLLPEDAQVLITEQGGGGRPVYATYALGSGRVIVTTLTLEFEAHSTQTLVNHFYWAINGPNARPASIAARAAAPSVASSAVAPAKATRNTDGSPRQ